jgi:CheY-like chemotaxis protein
MSPRAACRLETLGFDQVYDDSAGKTDWLAHGLAVEGADAGRLQGDPVNRRRPPRSPRAKRAPLGLAHIRGLWAGLHARHRRSCDRGDDMSIRCLIVDDNASFRQEMRGLLEEQGLEVVGGAASVADALAQITALRPEVALIDIDLGGESGLALARRLKETPGRSAPDVILISTHDEWAFAHLIERSPALGFLSKTELSAEAIRRLFASATSETGRSDERPGT